MAEKGGGEVYYMIKTPDLFVWQGLMIQERVLKKSEMGDDMPRILIFKKPTG